MAYKRYIVYFLMATGMIMLGASLIPHHHHNDEIVCMKDDMETESPCSHHHNDDPCCTSLCATQLELSAPTQLSDKVQPVFIYCITLFFKPLLQLAIQPEERTVYRGYVYLELLHGTFITGAAGLRAPPPF